MKSVFISFWLVCICMQMNGQVCKFADCFYKIEAHLDTITYSFFEEKNEWNFEQDIYDRVNAIRVLIDQVIDMDDIDDMDDMGDRLIRDIEQYFDYFYYDEHSSEELKKRSKVIRNDGRILKNYRIRMAVTKQLFSDYYAHSSQKEWQQMLMSDLYKIPDTINIEKLHLQIKTLGTRLDNINTTMGEMTVTINKLESKIEELEGQLSGDIKTIVKTRKDWRIWHIFGVR